MNFYNSDGEPIDVDAIERKIKMYNDGNEIHRRVAKMLSDLLSALRNSAALVVIAGGASQVIEKHNVSSTIILDFDDIKAGDCLPSEEAADLERFWPDHFREYEKVLETAGCPECRRSFGPHYTGPCDH